MSRKNRKNQQRKQPDGTSLSVIDGGKAKVKNNQGRFSGLGTEFDFSQFQQPASVPLSPSQQDQFAVQLYYSDWAAKKIVNIPVDDMLRDGWDYDGVDDAQKSKLVTMQDALGALKAIKQAMRLERLIGGCVIFMGIADGAESPAVPVNYQALRPGALKFLNVIPRTRVTKTTINHDPVSAGYGRPETYMVNGTTIHTSRLIIFDGDPLTQVPDSTLMPMQWVRNDGFGVSILMSVLDDLSRATGSRQAAYQLVQRASVFLFQSDIMDLEGSKDGQAALQKMQNIVNQINLFRGAVVDRQPGQNDPITTISPSFGSVPELVMSFLQILSAASDIPATRFIGQAPGGLNATGESDLENYYGRLESERMQTLRPQLLKLLSVMGPSALGADYDQLKIDVTFEPLWSLSELEQSQVRTADTTNTMAMYTANLLSDAEALEELKERGALKIDIEPDGGELVPAADGAEQLQRALDELQGQQ